MFLKTTKRIYNEEIDNYSSLLARIKNLLVKDEDYTGHNLSTIFLDNAKKKTLFQPIPILPISSGRVKTYEDRLKSEITLLEEEVAVLHGFYDKSIYEDSLFRGSNSLFESLKFIFSKGSMSSTKKELREKVRQLKAERKEALEQLYRKVSRQKDHLEKSRSLYSLLVDLREDLRRVRSEERRVGKECRCEWWVYY